MGLCVHIATKNTLYRQAFSNNIWAWGLQNGYFRRTLKIDLLQDLFTFSMSSLCDNVNCWLWNFAERTCCVEPWARFSYSSSLTWHYCIDCYKQFYNEGRVSSSFLELGPGALSQTTSIRQYQSTLDDYLVTPLPRLPLFSLTLTQHSSLGVDCNMHYNISFIAQLVAQVASQILFKYYLH